MRRDHPTHQIHSQAKDFGRRKEVQDGVQETQTHQEFEETEEQGGKQGVG